MARGRRVAVRRFLLAVAAVFSLTLVACDSSSGGDETADTVGGGDDAAVGADGTGESQCPQGAEGEILFSFEADGEIFGTPAVGPDGTVYVVTKAFHVYAIGCDGELRWTHDWDTSDLPDGVQSPRPPTASPVVGSDGRIYIGDAFVLDADGNRVWHDATWSAASQRDASPALASDGTLYVGSGEASAGKAGRLQALTPAGDAVAGFPIALGAIEAAPIVVGGDVFVAHATTGSSTERNHNQFVSSFDGAGATRWDPSAELAVSDGFPQSHVPMSGLAVDGQGRILTVVSLVPSANSEAEVTLVRLDPADGSVVETTRLGGAGCSGDCAPIVRRTADGQEQVLVPVGGGIIDRVLSGQANAQPFALLEIPAFGGVERWPVPAAGDDGHVYAVGAASELMAGGPAASIYKLADDGSVVEEYPFGGDTEVVTTSVQLSDDGVLVVGTRDGRVFAIRSGAGGPDGAAPWPLYRHDAHNTGAVQQ